MRRGFRDRYRVPTGECSSRLPFEANLSIGEYGNRAPNILRTGALESSGGGPYEICDGALVRAWIRPSWTAHGACGNGSTAAVPLAFEVASIKVAPVGRNGVRGGCHRIDSVYTPQQRIGNITSPLFGQANQMAGGPNGEGFSENANNRRLELQTRFTF